MPNFSKPFVIEVDASGFALGTVLMQDDKPMAFHSQVLGLRAWKKSTYEKELMPIVFAVLKWRSYLLGRNFFVCTNQKSLKFLFEQREIGQEYQKWVCKLLGYGIEIYYKVGLLNRTTDALSRRPNLVECGSLLIPQWRDWDKLRVELKQDVFLTHLVIDLAQVTTSHVGFQLKDDLLFYKGRLVIPRSSSFVPMILAKFHSSPVGGHSGETKTCQRIASELY